MSESVPPAQLIARELVELWILTCGEPPPVIHDPPLMMRLIEAAADAPEDVRRRA